MTPKGKALKEQCQWKQERSGKGSRLPATFGRTLPSTSAPSVRLDNFHKLSCDALSGIAYADDSQIKRTTVTLAYDKARPRIELAISELA
jgi:Holliday junction resolvase RusA-like endonuclease